MTRQRIGQGWGTSPHYQILADQLILIWPNFYISSNFIWTSFIWFDPTWSNLVSYDPIWSKLISFNPIWFNVQVGLWCHGIRKKNISIFWQFFSYLFDEWVAKNMHWNLIMAFCATSKIEQPIWPCFGFALKTPSWDFYFLPIFEILVSNQ